MRKIMFSQPMAGYSDDEIVETRNRAVKFAQDNGYQVINTYFTDEFYSKESMDERGVVQVPLQYMAKGIENMSLCHAVYFCLGWEKARGCIIEHEVAVKYGLDIIYEKG